MKSINVVKKLQEEDKSNNSFETNIAKEKHNKKVYQFFDSYMLPIIKRDFAELDETHFNYLKNKCMLLINEMYLGFPSSENSEDYSKLKYDIDNLKNQKEIAEELIDFVLYQFSKHVETAFGENNE